MPPLSPLGLKKRQGESGKGPFRVHAHYSRHSLNNSPTNPNPSIHFGHVHRISESGRRGILTGTHPTRTCPHSPHRTRPAPHHISTTPPLPSHIEKQKGYNTRAFHSRRTTSQRPRNFFSFGHKSSQNNDTPCSDSITPTDPIIIGSSRPSTSNNTLVPLGKNIPETQEEVATKKSFFWNRVYDHIMEGRDHSQPPISQQDVIAAGQHVIMEQKMKAMTRLLAEKHREQQLLLEIKQRKVNAELLDLTNRILEPFAPNTDFWGNQPDHFGTRHEFSNLQPLLIPTDEFPSHLQTDVRTLLEKTGLNRFTDMIIELKDDFVDYINKKEPFGQRKKDRKYRLKNKMNKPYVRYTLDEEDDDDVAIEIKHFKEVNSNYHKMRLDNERRAIELKRKARVAMGLDPDLELERRWYEITGDRQSLEPEENLLLKKKSNDFEAFRQQYIDNFRARKRRKRVFKEAGITDPEGPIEIDGEDKEFSSGAIADQYTDGALNDRSDVEKYRWPIKEDMMKSRRQIYDTYDGLPMWRDDLLGLTRTHVSRMPADEEDLDYLEQAHWRRKIKAANKKKYFKGGWKYDGRMGAGAKLVAPISPARNKGRVNRSRWPVTKYGFNGTRGPRSAHLIYDYLYGRRIKTVRGHGGVTSVGLFQKFPRIFKTRQPDIPWTGTTALTYSPEQNHITKWELRRQTLKFKISMSPLGDLGRWVWNLYNIDMFPFTHFRYPFAWIMTNLRWAMGLRHALARWSKTATHEFIDQRFAYQSNRYGEYQNKDIFHFVNEYDYLKDYQLPTVVRAIREYDFDVLRSACSKHALFCIIKWLHLQERFGIYSEYRRNYWIESLDIREVRKDEHEKIILNVEFVLVEPPYYYNRAGGKIFHQKAQYKGLYRPQPLIMTMTLLRDYAHPDFDYEVIDFAVDARRIKRTFNNIERIYHAAQRSRTQYFAAPKFYAVRRTAVETPYYSRRTRVVNAFKSQLEAHTFAEKELDFSADMEAKHNEMTKYRNTMQLGKYITALQLEPIMDYIVAQTKTLPAFTLHPIIKDKRQYWEQRKELDLVKFRQREARRIRAQQNTLHRYFHKLRAVAYFKHTYDHGGDFHEFRRLHIDKLATDANHDDWVQKWLVDPERAGRPVFKGNKRFYKRMRKSKLRKKRRKFHKNKKRRHFRRSRMINRWTKRLRRRKKREHFNARHRRKFRRRYKKRKKRMGHQTSRRRFKKRRRFLPYMERVYHRMPRGVFNEYNKMFKSRNNRVNRFKGVTTQFSTKQKGPGYSVYDTSWYEKWHVWDGGYYNPNEDCYTRADVFHPSNNPFEPRRQYLLSFMDDNTIRIPFQAFRQWDLPWRINFTGPWSKKPRYKHMFHRSRGDRFAPRHLRFKARARDRLRFQHIPNAENFEINDDAQWEHQDELRAWPKPEDEKWDV